MTASAGQAKAIQRENTMMHRFALLATLIVGCSDPYGEAQKTDTIAGWETFITENPKNPKRSMGQIRLEELYLEAARTAGTLEGYDTYMEKYPKGRLGGGRTSWSAGVSSSVRFRVARASV